MLRAIVNASRNIVCGPEMRVIPALCHLNQQIEDGHLDVLEANYGLDAQALHDRFARTIDRLLTPLHHKTGARVAEKTPANILHFPRLRRLFPDSPLIAVVRDGRDVVASLLSMDWTDARTGQPMAITRDATAAARLWVQSVEAGRKLADDPGFIELRYERLASDPQAEIGHLFDRLGEDEAALARALDHVRHFDRAAGQAESSAERVSQPIDKTAIGRWQRDLTPGQIRQVEHEAGPVLEALGYV
ncbi:sulfotransferase family protein [Maricaulis parjimensis]|uniref:sulfotransferase family protein n=1 Tax=Maricaulis parjimensis TaxID=144023 RepID=UPI001939D252